MEPLPWESDSDVGMARQETWLLSFIDILALLLTLFVLLLALQDRGQSGAGDEAVDPPPASPVFFSLLSLDGGPQLQREASGYAMPGAGLVPMAATRDAAGDRQPENGTQAAQARWPAGDDSPRSSVDPTGTATAAAIAAPLPVDIEDPDDSVAEPDAQPVAASRPAAGEQVTPVQQTAAEEREEQEQEEQAESVAGTASPETTAVTAGTTPDLSPITPEAQSPATRQAAQRLLHNLQVSPLGERVEVITRTDAVNLVISDSILFAPASADLSAAGQVLLGQLADVLRTLPYSVSVEGHTDNVPIHTPLYPSNWELSSARAASVTRRLIEQGVARERLRTVGYGDTRPRSDNATAEARAKNRRVTFVLRVDDPR